MDYMKTILLASLLSLAANANAQDPITGSVSKVYPHSSGKIYFKLLGDSCNSEWRYYYFDDSTDALKEANKSRYALLLSAATSKTPVTINVDNCIADENEIVKEIWIAY